MPSNSDLGCVCTYTFSASAPTLLQMLAPFEIVQFDMEAAEPMRDERGLCIPVEPGMGPGSFLWVEEG